MGMARAPVAPRPVPVILHPIYQDLWRPWRLKGYKGGRGSGKSHAFAEATVSHARTAAHKIVCGRQFQNSIDESVKALVEAKIQTFKLADEFRITNKWIEHRRTGSVFLFIGLDRNPSSAKSLEGGTILWLEEGQSINERSLDIIMPTIRAEGSEIWIAWNPESPEDPVDQLLCGPVKRPDAVVHHVGVEHNLYFHRTTLPAEMEAMRQRDPLKFRHIWLGEYRKLADTQVFKSWRVGRLDVPATARALFGLDFGFATDPNALVKVYLLGERTLYVAAELVAANVPIAAMPAWLDRMPEVRRYPIVADSSRPETIDHLKRSNFIVRGAVKGAGSVEDGIAWLQGLDIVVSPDCPVTAAELKNLSYQLDRITRTVLPVVEDANNHCIDAIRYAVEDARRGARPMLIGR